VSDWPDLAGRLDQSGHVLPVRVYYEDTDFTGIVYHGAYVRFFERARSDFLRLIGIHHSELAEGDDGTSLAFAVRTMTWISRNLRRSMMSWKCNVSSRVQGRQDQA
jgi:acyl-CoA thioester hydrolase